MGGQSITHAIKDQYPPPEESPLPLDPLEESPLPLEESPLPLEESPEESPEESSEESASNAAVAASMFAKFSKSVEEPILSVPV